jgi:hypothetical protein
MDSVIMTIPAGSRPHSGLLKMYEKYSLNSCPAIKRFKYATVLIPPATASPKPVIKINSLKIIGQPESFLLVPYILLLPCFLTYI